MHIYSLICFLETIPSINRGRFDEVMITKIKKTQDKHLARGETIGPIGSKSTGYQKKATLMLEIVLTI